MACGLYVTCKELMRPLNNSWSLQAPLLLAAASYLHPREWDSAAVQGAKSESRAMYRGESCAQSAVVVTSCLCDVPGMAHAVWPIHPTGAAPRACVPWRLEVG